jgi:hypothetical protein
MKSDYARYQLIARATYLRLRLRYQLVAAATYLADSIALIRNTGWVAVASASREKALKQRQ